jgi:hypothetical protein
MSPRKNLAEAEQDIEEAFEVRRELAKVLVEKITVSRSEEGRAKVEITYRFGSPAGNGSAFGSQNSGVLYTARNSAPAHGHGCGVEWRCGYPDVVVAGDSEYKDYLGIVDCC